MAGDFVSAPRYPSPDYTAFGNALGNLVNDYQSAQDNAQRVEQSKLRTQQDQLLLDQQRAFVGGVPLGPDGRPDINKIMSVLAQKGNPNAISSLYPLVQRDQELQPTPLSPDAQRFLGGGGAPAAPAGGGTFTDSLRQTESGNRNVYSTVDPDVSGPNTRSQGFYQINVPTWRDFAPRAGVDVSKYPTPMSAPEEVQRQVAEVIPFARFGPRTRAALEKQYGFGEGEKSLTIGQLAARFSGGGQQPQQRGPALAYASRETGTASDASPSIPPVSAAAGSTIPRATDNGGGFQAGASPFGSPIGVRADAREQGGGGPSVASLAGPSVSPGVVANIARAVGTDPNAPLTPDQAARAQKIVQNYAARTGRPVPQGAQGGPGASQAQPQQQPLFPLPPLPDGYPQTPQGYMAAADKAEQLAAQLPNTRGNAQNIKLLQQRAEDWRKAAQPHEMMPGRTFVDAYGNPVYQPQGAGRLDDATITQMAQQARAGDASVFQNLGRGVQGAENIVRLRQEIARQNAQAGTTGADQAIKNAEFQGVKAGQRTLAQKQAVIEMAATEFKGVLPVVQEASRKVSRTNYPSLNRIIQMGEEGTGDQNIVAFGAGVNGLINLYARAISPTGAPTVSDKDHAREILNKAWSQGQFDAATGMMQREIDAALNSPEKVRDEMRRRFGGGSKTETDSKGEKAGGAPAKPGKVSTKAEFDALPSGAEFIAPDGSHRRKP
jgi:hypothetical protein